MAARMIRPGTIVLAVELVGLAVSVFAARASARALRRRDGR